MSCSIEIRAPSSDLCFSIISSTFFISIGQYQKEFDAHPGTYWYSVDYMERNKSGSGLGAGFTGEIDGVYEEYVEKYGQENADYLMEVMGEWGQHYERAVFIDTGIVNGQHFETMAQEQAELSSYSVNRSIYI